ncbi:MAG: tetratricopeptide repeat protein, partial [Candidatus Methylomirabilales bacterium]
MIYFIILLIGAAAILPVAYPLFRRAGRPGKGMDEREEFEDLRAKRERLYDAVRELEFEHEAGSVSTADYEKARVSYEMEAAALLQEEERQGGARRRPSPDPLAAKAAAVHGRSPQLGLLIPAAIILVVGVGLGFFLATSLQPRQGDMSITGTLPGGEAASLQSADEDFNRGDLRTALDGYKRILEQDPHNVEALTQIGVILARAGHYDDALLAFDQALRVRPTDPKALFHKGLVFF